MLEHILVVEDDEFMRASLETELKLAGYRVSLAESGEQAIEMAHNQHFDLVVCDIRMPGLNGIDTLSTLREIQPSARNIVMTGYADADAPIKAVKLKVDDYLMKPFSADDFLLAVKKALHVQLQELRRQRTSRQLRSLLLATTRQLADPELAVSCQSAAQRACLLGRQLALSPARLEALQLACWLQPLREQLDLVDDLKSLTLLLDQASEEWEGGGPRGWRHKQIPLDARILRIALGQTQGTDPELTPLLQEDAPQASEALARPPQGLLALARSYFDAGQLELSQVALERALEAELEAETAAQAWLFAGRLHHERGRHEAASEAARQAEEAAQRCGLDSIRAEAILLRAALGSVSPKPEELEQARQIFQTYEDSQSLSECELWLALAGQESALQRLLETLQGDNALWVRHPVQLAKALQPACQEKSLAKAVQLAGERALGLLEEWLQPGSALELRLKALDLLALLDTPTARALLTRCCSSDSPALAQKSQLLSQRTSPPESPQLQLFMLGRMRLSLAGLLLQDDGLAAKKNRSLMAYLAWRRPRETSEDVLIDLFWPDSGPKSKHSLHNAIYQIRKALKAHLGDVSEQLLRLTHGYSLESHPCLWVDVEEFLRHCEAAQRAFEQNQNAQAVAELKKAELLYRGDFLEGIYDDWAETARQQIQERLTQLLTALGRHFFESSRFEVSLDYWKRLLARDNCSEDAYLGCMLSYLALGRQGEAVRAYHQCAQTLRQELNLAPPPRLVETYLKLQAGEAVDLALPGRP
ncbi:response regulator [bacterium]|nr:response regulator [bacterium]